MRGTRARPGILLLAGTVLLFSLPEATSKAQGRPASSGGEPGEGRGPHTVVTGFPSFELGRRIFFEETFAGNGRTCATCHVPGAGFSITPELIQAIFAADPDHPLFRAIDSDAGDGVSYSILLQRAVFRVRIPLHPAVRLSGDPDQRVLELRRAVPSILNLALTAPYQAEGRKADLPSQALGAVEDHFEALRLPSLRELRALEVFQRELFDPPLLASLLDPGDPAGKPDGFSMPLSSPAAERGRDLFIQHCASCHGGEPANVTGPSVDGPFQTTFVSERNLVGARTFRLIFNLSDGTEKEVTTPDPGRAAVTGRIEDLHRFDVPTLRGIRHTAPYFHDNSAASLREVIDHYNLTFGFAIIGRREDELLAFLETL